MVFWNKSEYIVLGDVFAVIGFEVKKKKRKKKELTLDKALILTYPGNIGPNDINMLNICLLIWMPPSSVNVKSPIGKRNVLGKCGNLGTKICGPYLESGSLGAIGGNIPGKNPHTWSNKRSPHNAFVFSNNGLTFKSYNFLGPTISSSIGPIAFILSGRSDANVNEFNFSSIISMIPNLSSIGASPRLGIASGSLPSLDLVSAASAGVKCSMPGIHWSK